VHQRAVRLEANVRVFVLEVRHKRGSITCAVWPMTSDFGRQRANPGIVVHEVCPQARTWQRPIARAGRGQQEQKDHDGQSDLVKGLEARVLAAPDEGETVGGEEGDEDAEDEGREVLHLPGEPPGELLAEESQPGRAEQEAIENQPRARAQADARQPGSFPLRPSSAAYISRRLQSDLPSGAPMVHGPPDPLLMHKPWARKRTADAIPTPVAVALGAFCRKAGAPATPTEVREALRSLGAEEDFRVSTLTENEPPARPLGPYAVVDILGGTAPGLAAQREACGYYQLVRDFLAAEAFRVESRLPSPEGPLLEASASPAQRPPAAPPPTVSSSTRQRGRLAVAPTMAERIAPKRRLGGAGAPAAALPRGRFAQLPSEQPSLDALGPAQLADLLAQHGHRPALLRALTSGRAQHVSGPALDRALETAGLLLGAVESECELVLSTLEEQRGAVGRAAWALGVRANEFLAWAERLGVTVAVERIRDRYRREALQPAPWTARLDLLGKRKYLEDLGVTVDFERSVTEDLRRALEATQGAPEERTAVLANRLGVAPEALRRSLLRLGLLPATTPSTLPQPV
jgi:hypothetical protein